MKVISALKKLLFVGVLFISSPSVAEFNLKAGLSLSDESNARPEVNLPDPLGILRLEYETENENTVFCEHISSFPKIEKGSGLNHCGILFEF